MRQEGKKEKTPWVGGEERARIRFRRLILEQTSCTVRGVWKDFILLTPSSIPQLHKNISMDLTSENILERREVDKGPKAFPP